MLFLLIGAVVLLLLLVGMRVFERASVGSIRVFLTWLAAFFGFALAVLLALSGFLPRALGALVMVGPLAWRYWQRRGAGFARFQGTSSTGGGSSRPPPPRPGGPMTREEASEILGLRQGASKEEIQAAHHRLMRAAHPDTGGSDWLASRINQARDVLLG